jgi:UDP-GlcNAc:undecaprenyl-phosphate GlcNAc-1-phosphate transferase
MRLGHGQRRAVFILWAWTAVLAGFVLAPTYTNEGNALVPFGIAALALALYAIFHPVARRTRRNRATADPGADAGDVVLPDEEIDLDEAVGEVIPLRGDGRKPRRN